MIVSREIKGAPTNKLKLIRERQKEFAAHGPVSISTTAVLALFVFSALDAHLKPRFPCFDRSVQTIQFLVGFLSAMIPIVQRSPSIKCLLRGGDNSSDEHGHQIEREARPFRRRFENASRRGARVLIGRRD